jgi:hypothetical protein
MSGTMGPKNRYYRGSHLSERKLREVIRHFAHDLPASNAAQLTGVTRKTVNTIYLKIRQRIAEELNAAGGEEDKEITAEGFNRERSSIGAGNSQDVNPTNDQNNFINYMSRRLQKFKGLSDRTSQLHLAETRWRWRNRHNNLYQEILKLLTKKPLGG